MQGSPAQARPPHPPAAVTLRLPAPPAPQVATDSSCGPSGWCGAASAQPLCSPSPAAMGRSQRWAAVLGCLRSLSQHSACLGGAPLAQALERHARHPCRSDLSLLPCMATSVYRRCCSSMAGRRKRTSASSLCRYAGLGLACPPRSLSIGWLHLIAARGLLRTLPCNTCAGASACLTAALPPTFTIIHCADALFSQPQAPKVPGQSVRLRGSTLKVWDATALMAQRPLLVVHDGEGRGH